MMRIRLRGSIQFLFPTLGRREVEILSYVITEKDPCGARNISLNCDIPRNKVYHGINNLIAAEIIESVIIKLSDLDIPDIWEWWTDTRKKRWKKEQGVSSTKWILRREKILVRIEQYQEQLKELQNLKRFILS